MSVTLVIVLVTQFLQQLDGTSPVHLNCGWLEGVSEGSPCRCGPHLGGGVHSLSHTHYIAVTWTKHREPVKLCIYICVCVCVEVHS